MTLEINQQYAVIGLRIQEPQLNLHTEKPVLQISTSKASLEIKSRPPDLDIDQSVCYTSGLHMDIDEFARYFARKGQQACLEGTARRAQEGRRMAEIHNPGALKQIVASRQRAQDDYPYLEMKPAPPPEIEFEIYPLQMRYTPGEVRIESTSGYVENNFQRGYVEVYLDQKNMIDINYTGTNVNQTA